VAVVQISKIQIRRGQKNSGSGLPQLASGELGWAIDSRELYIGNGAVAEGAPAVGNTKVLTEHDNLFTLVDTYAYRANDPFIVTGTSATNPVYRSLQERLDDIVSGRAFGLTGIESQNATPLLQKAIDQLFLNSATVTNPSSRVVLHLEPGVYTISQPIYLPPHCTIVGAGIDKTIIKQTTTSAVFFTQNELLPANKAGQEDDSGSSEINQARQIRIENLTLQTTSTNGKGLVLQSCRDSLFRNVKIAGPWVSGDTIPAGLDSNIAIQLNSLSGPVSSNNNKFENCEIVGWAIGVSSSFDTKYNEWSGCKFITLGHGFAFGTNMLLGAPASGQSVGPTHSIITKSLFKDIDRHGLYIENGNYNLSQNNTFEYVGNEGGTDAQPVFSVIKFNKASNASENDYFSRTSALSYDQANITNVVYVPEVEGNGFWTWGFEHVLNISNGSGVKIFRLPNVANQGFEVDYIMTSANYFATRTGTLTISLNGFNGTVEVSDDYHFAGDEIYLDKIYFDATLTDEDGDATDETVSMLVTSTMPSDDNTQFKFKVKTKKSSVI
jgi:hypothetical protein